MALFVNFIPILLFVTLFVGSGVYFTYLGKPNAFYQLSPLVAILPAIMLGWILHKGKTQQRMNDFLDGIRHRDIITMCLIFLLAGAFSEVTKAIGSVDATVNLALSLIPPQFLLIGLFLTAAFISTAIGTSMGTIATIAPIAAGLSTQGVIPGILGVATVIGGAMFGDNLSIISDTTIAAVMSQEADTKLKLKLNAKVASITSVITMAILYWQTADTVAVTAHDYSLILITPYIVLIALACGGVNVFVSIILSLVYAGIIGAVTQDYDVLRYSHDITKGFASVHELMLLSLLVGGLSGLAGNNAVDMAEYFNKLIAKQNSQKMAQLLIGKIVSLFDILLANNVIAVIFSGEISRNIARRYDIPPHYTATWLDTFSCVFQGILPYGAQVLLASSLIGVSPLAVTPHVYYCYILGFVAIGYIVFKRSRLEQHNSSQR